MTYGTRLRKLEDEGQKLRGRYPFPIFGDDGVYGLNGVSCTAAEVAIYMECLGYEEYVLIDDNVPPGGAAE